MTQVTKPKPELIWLPLEPYRARYTELMSCVGGWTDTALSKSFRLNRISPPDSQATTVIQNGRVLDSVNRPLWALDQVKLLLQETQGGKVFLEDFFHPGVEAIPYARPESYRLYSFCWAQTFDRFDFTREMVTWMRAYEAMMLTVARKTFVASPLLQDFILTSFPTLTEEQVPYVGLPFDSLAVKKLFDATMQPEPLDVVYSSRFDKEKDPNFFLDVVERMSKTLKFAICTGHPELKGNDYAAVARAKHLAEQGKLQIFANLEKKEYYSILKATKVQFNCAHQDWVSFTLLEALSHGCLPAYPARRDFNNVFEHAPEFLYIPGSLNEACALIDTLVKVNRQPQAALQQILDFHDHTYERISDHILRDN